MSFLITDAIIDAIRINLNTELDCLQKKLSSHNVDTPEKWFQKTEEAVKSVGLSWIVARSPGKSSYHHGDDQPVSIVKRINKRVSNKPINIKSVDDDNLDDETDDDTITIYPSEDDDPNAENVIALPIDNRRLWLGASRRAFGDELHFEASPWKFFLSRLTEMVQTAYVRISALIEIQDLYLREAKSLALKETLVTAGTMSHELSNFAKDFSSGIATLDEALEMGTLVTKNPTLELLIQSMKASTYELSAILKPLLSTTAFDEDRPCGLRKAIAQASKLYASWLVQRNISFEVEIDEEVTEIMIDIPFHIAALAIANLISNAMNAIDRNGSITISISETATSIKCRISDTGPGIPREIGDRIFQPGLLHQRKERRLGTLPDATIVA